MEALRQIEFSLTPNRLSEDEIYAIFEDARAVLTDSHFVYAAGDHGTAYINKDAVFPYTKWVSRLCEEIASRVTEEVDVVVGPALGGIILSQWLAYHLSAQGREVLAVFAEKETITIPDPEGKGRRCFIETGNLAFNRGYAAHVHGKRVIVAEDILNSGGSAAGAVQAVRKAGGHVVGVTALVNRGKVLANTMDVPWLISLLDVELEKFTEAECKLVGPCSKKVLINTLVGKGKSYLDRSKSN